MSRREKARRYVRYAGETIDEQLEKTGHSRPHSYRIRAWTCRSAGSLRRWPRVVIVPGIGAFRRNGTAGIPGLAAVCIGIVSDDRIGIRIRVCQQLVTLVTYRVPRNSLGRRRDHELRLLIPL